VPYKLLTYKELKTVPTIKIQFTTGMSHNQTLEFLNINNNKTLYKFKLSHTNHTKVITFVIPRKIKLNLIS
jgi:hypothetical protein